MYQEKIINLETGTETIRAYTDAEIAEVEAAKEATEAEAAKLAAEQAEKNAAKQALLDKLGITADEAKLLLGGI
jgi:hypothetical protein